MCTLLDCGPASVLYLRIFKKNGGVLSKNQLYQICDLNKLNPVEKYET